MRGVARIVLGSLGLCVFLAGGPAKALEGGPDAFGYSFIDSNEPGGPLYDFEVLGGNIASTASTCDDCVQGNIPIGFDFEYYGTVYDVVSVSSNGFIGFGAQSATGCCSGASIPSTSTPNNIIALWWEDLNPSNGGSIYYETLGSPPLQRFVLSFQNVQHYGGGNPVSVQVKLYEGSSSIEIHVDAAPSDGGTHSCGIEDSGGNVGLQYHSGSQPLPSGTAIWFGTCSEDDIDLDGYTECEGDCDDMDPSLYPAAEEICDDGIDQNCDAQVDEHADFDGDGFSNCDGDCNDFIAEAFPGNPEDCDFIDNDCDGWVDNGYDIDGDGWTTCEGDCDDADGGTWPSAPELCDGVDSDCMDDLPSTEVDNDGDGYAECDGDCHDGSAATYPGAEEICDTQDNDCDPITDELGDVDLDGYSICQGDCNDGDAGMNPAQAEVCDKKDNDCNGMVDDNIDFDHDGYPGCGGADCEDYNAAIHPGAQEVPYDNIDQDCDGADLTDLDGDGFSGGPGQPDCMDDNAAVHPDAEENCEDGLDNNCDGAVDDEDETCLVSADDDDDDDCSCDATGDDRAPSVALLAVLAVLAIVRRRR